MQPDDTLCYCFHVSQRKVVNYLRLHRPRVPSQLSGCGGAGTGCGWCIPFLKKLHAQYRAGEEVGEALSPEEYAAGRDKHIEDGKGTPPRG